MRKEFVTSFLEVARRDQRVLFLTGDLGFMALEPLQKELGERFINAGVAEQNMVSVAAGLAARGFQPWLYSIAPFVTLRPFEQLRNDVCLHNLDVKVVGNGGGFGYGIMGSTHHVLEDVGCMQMLPNMKVSVPCFSEDVGEIVNTANHSPGPRYLRLGQGVSRQSLPPAANWRKLSSGKSAVVVGSGPILKALLPLVSKLSGLEFTLYDISEFPLTSVPEKVVREIETCGALVTFEEHIAAGGLGQSLCQLLMGSLKTQPRYLSLCVQGYLSGKYGSQNWHWEENGLAGQPLQKRLTKFLTEKAVGGLK